jgi:hypothetical protein
VDVLFVYPQDLAAVEERFGSWMVQYGYANLVSAEKLVQTGLVEPGGWLNLNGWRYRAVCLLFEPFPSAALLDLLEAFVNQAGIVVWSATPPRLMLEGGPVAAGKMAEIFGIQWAPAANLDGLALPGRTIQFLGKLAAVQPMTILTDFLVDRVYPIQPIPGCLDVEVVANVRTGGASPVQPVGVRKVFPGGGQAVFLGFRPRDDQSASTGSEIRTWFEILFALGAYPGSGRFDTPDNPSVVSRQTDYLACQFPNGALAVSPHYRWHEENWPGGFFRNPEMDLSALEANPLPDDAIHLRDFRLAGQEVSYAGRHCLAWNLAGPGRLVAFAGLGCSSIRLNGQEYRWSEEPVDVAWNPLPGDQAVEGYQPLFRVWCGTVAAIRLPLMLENPDNLEVRLGASLPRSRTRRGRPRSEAARAGYTTQKLSFQVDAGDLVLMVTEEIRDHWLYVIRKA